MAMQLPSDSEEDRMSADDKVIAMRGLIEPWIEICDSLEERNRFSLRPELDKLIMDLIAHVEENHCKVVPPGTILFRARINPKQSDGEVPPLAEAEMGAPPPSRATAGRINPEGIPYLYTTEEEKTAVAEVRPWIGAQVTVARFETTAGLSLANAVSSFPPPSLTDPFHWIWQQLISLQSFSKPVQPGAGTKYVVGQYLSERLKNAGFHGLRYESVTNESGTNIALFDQHDARITSRRVVEITKIDCHYESLAVLR
ncbi:MAG: RES family NAD+ phosphorylase [Myxococcota bacterium]